MIRTIVCQREGCNGNAFYINSHDGEMSVVCNMKLRIIHF